MNTYLIKNATIVNEGKQFVGGVLIKDGKIEEVFEGDFTFNDQNVEQIDATGKFLLPGAIDDQVHFREPGLTHKAEIYTESRAAVAGGITSFMEMPNTNPQTVTVEALEDKFKIASERSLANYSFYIGATNNNIEQVLAADKSITAGIKIFMGSSTGNMLVDNETALREIFSKGQMLIATHCEDEEMVQRNTKAHIAQYGEDIPIDLHPVIRDAEACYKSSSFAVGLAKETGAKLHILHISTEKELSLFDNSIPLEDKRITAEVCIHHLYFSREDYKKKGTFIKWNPAVKEASDREAIWKALLDDTLDVIATDHAPHTKDEKNNVYTKAPSGGPLVQHALVSMLQFVKEGKISLERVVHKMSHAPAILYQVANRGYIRKGYWADLVLVDMNNPWEVSESNIISKCKWSPFEGTTYDAQIDTTFINGRIAYKNGTLIEGATGMQVSYNR